MYEGQFFEEFRDDPKHYRDRRFTHVIDPFEIPKHWTVYRSFDWGYHRPFSCGWWAVDPDGVAYRILEFYGCTGEPNEGLKWPPQQVFAKIHAIEREHRYLTGKKSSALQTRPSGTAPQENPSPTRRQKIRCISPRETTSVFPAGCSCTTG